MASTTAENPQSKTEDPKSLDTSSLKKFAQAARVQLRGIVESKLERVLADDSLTRRESERAVAVLEKEVEDSSREQVIERVAYTWFNRFCALRFMDVNRYTKLGTVSPVEGFSQPEILADAKQGVIDEDWKVDSAKVLGLLDGSLASSNPQEEAYQLLLIGVCNSLNSIMPTMFQKIADYTELLIPDDLLSDSSILTATRQALTPENCQNVEVIGWLYQFYISEKKDDVFAALKKGKKITPENIPAATQLFTPHWIVRYLVENSLGRLWMLNFPESKLREKMDYYIEPAEAVDSGQGLVVSKGDRNEGSELQGSDCLAESDGVGDGGLSADEAVSEGGTLWTDQSGPAGGSVDSLEHRGGTGAQGNGGVPELPEHRPRVAGGSGDATPNSPQSQLHHRSGHQQSTRLPHRDRQNAQQPHEKTSHQPLTT